MTVAVVFLLPSASAAGSVTIGSNLSSAPALGINCALEMGCTFSHKALPVPNTAPGGLVAPFDGVVVRWRIKVSPATFSWKVKKKRKRK